MINSLVKGFIIFIGLLLVIFRIGRENLIKNVPKIFNSSLEKIIKPAQLINPGLALGSSGEEVRILQSALSTDKNIYPSGIVSGYFGDLTKQAVMNFQKKYKILPSGKVDEATAKKFNEIYGVKDKEYYLNLYPTQTVVQININDSQLGQAPEEWGKAKQISEHSYTMNVGFDDRMATPQEILTALNSYRQKHGRNSLNWDDRLADYASFRAKYFTSINNLDDHAGFEEYVNNEDNLKKLGFWWVGENSSFGYRLEAVHLIEWVYAGDKPHDDNQLSSDWTHVGIGVDGYQTDLIFGGQPM
jgi:uncharacterized protein YkwD